MADVPAATSDTGEPSGDSGDILSEVLPPDRVPVVRPDGTLASVRQSKYQEAIDQGYRFQAPEEQAKFRDQLKYGESPIKAGVAGALRGATLGLSDVVGPNLGISDRETLAGLKEANPEASVIGEIGGGVASLLIPGAQEVSGPALAAKLGKAVQGGLALKGAGLGSRLLGKAVAGAVEGTLYGAGNAVSEAALGDVELNADMLIAGGGLGMVLGAAGGGAGGLLEEGIGAATKAASSAIKKSNLAEFLGGKAEDFGAKAIGGSQSAFKGLSRDEVRAVARDVMDAGLIGKGDSAAQILPKIQTARKEAGEAIGSVLKEADDLAAAAPRPGVDVTAAGKGQVAAKPFDFEPAKQRLNSFFSELNPAEQDLIEGPIKKALDQMERAAKKDGAGFAAANDLKSTLQGEINYKVDAKAKTNLLKKAVGLFRDEIDTQLQGSVPTEVFERFIKAKKLFGSFSEAEKWGKRGVGALQGNRGFSLTDHIAGVGLGAIAGGPIGLITGAAGAIGNKVLRERGPSFAAHALDAIADHPAMAMVAKSFQEAVKKADPELLSHYGPLLLNAAAEGPAQALLTHAKLSAEDPGYRQVAAMAGFPTETPEEHSHSLEKAERLSVISGQLSGQNEDIEAAVDRVLSGRSGRLSSGPMATQDFGSKRMRRDSVAGHEKRVKEIQEMAADPSVMADRIAENLGPIGSHAPAIAASMTAAASRAVQYLANEARRPAKAGPLAREWTPTEEERHSFSKKLEVVQQPMTAIHAAAKGTLTEGQMEAFKAVYPALARRVGDIALKRITENPKSVPYGQRVMLSLLTGMDLDGTMNSQAIASNQTAMHATNQQPSGGQQSPGARDSQMTLANRLATPEQRREMEP